MKTVPFIHYRKDCYLRVVLAQLGGNEWQCKDPLDLHIQLKAIKSGLHYAYVFGAIMDAQGKEEGFFILIIPDHTPNDLSLESLFKYMGVAPDNVRQHGGGSLAIIRVAESDEILAVFTTTTFVCTFMGDRRTYVDYDKTEQILSEMLVMNIRLKYAPIGQSDLQKAFHLLERHGIGIKEILR